MKATKNAIMIFLYLFFSILIAGDQLIEEKTHVIDEKTLPISNPITLTILYDNYIFLENTRADWGFSCLVEGTEKTILFDTGTKPEILWHNINLLKKDMKNIDIIVLSHDHLDHTGGLWSVLEKNSHVTVFIPAVFPQEFFDKVKKTGAQVVKVTDSVNICNGVYTTGQMGTDIPEQGLILYTLKGVVLITGCSHPGIVRMLEHTKEITQKDIYLSLGGYHLMRHSDEQVEKIIKKFQNMGVFNCGATHCTGDRVIDMFKKAYGDHYVEMGAGRVIQIN
ncbi:MBL fold metallo-hydrolase [candidate division KSB1 bacterium]|nr:MBL fold metallo-hydrolase [candidate division KSB1 bacterium]